MAIAVAPGEAYYLPLRHSDWRGMQGELMIDSAGDRSATDAPDDRGLVSGGDDCPQPECPEAGSTVKNLPPLDSEEMKPLRDLLEDPAVRKTAQNSKYDVLVLRRAGVNLQGLDFDTMLASYVLDPGRRSHGLDVLALEFLEHSDPVVRGSLWQGQDPPCRLMNVRSRQPGIIRAKKRT